MLGDICSAYLEFLWKVYSSCSFIHAFVHACMHSFSNILALCILHSYTWLFRREEQFFAQDLWCGVGVIRGFLAEGQPKLQTFPRARQKALLTGAPRRVGVSICSGGDMLGGMATTDDVLKASP